MPEADDYVLRHVERSPAGHVTYHATDLYGQRFHVTVRYDRSVPAHVDPLLRRMITNHRPVPVRP